MNPGGATDSITFSITFYDECYDTNIQNALTQGLSAWPLFIETTFEYIPAYSSKSCGYISYTLTNMNADGTDPVIALTSNPPNSIRVYGDDAANHVGVYNMKIKACVTVYDDGQEVFCANCCADSPIFRVELIDPCVYTTITALPIQPMSVEQLQSESQDLSLTADWPVQDYFTFGTDQVSGMCGSLSYRIVASGTAIEPDYITFNPLTGMIELDPTVDSPSGLINLTMEVYLTDYTDVKMLSNFQIQIISTSDCAFDVITFGNDLDEETYTFTVPVNTQIFDPMVQQTVENCPRQCSFYENTEPLSLPSLFVQATNDQTGEVAFRTGSTFLDGSVFCILVVCESLESTMPES